MKKHKRAFLLAPVSVPNYLIVTGCMRSVTSLLAMRKRRPNVLQIYEAGELHSATSGVGTRK